MLGFLVVRKSHLENVLKFVTRRVLNHLVFFKHFEQKLLPRDTLYVTLLIK